MVLSTAGLFGNLVGTQRVESINLLSSWAGPTEGGRYGEFSRLHDKKRHDEEVLGVSGDRGEPERVGAVCADGGGRVAILCAACAGG